MQPSEIISKTVDGQLVEMVEFNGRTYTRHPESERYDRSRYFTGAGGKLHRVIWRFHNGPIPKRHHVHHKDGDQGNNRIENLECMTPEEHCRRHADEKSAWIKNMWSAYEYREVICSTCKQPYKTRTQNQKACYCSPKCKLRGRYAAGATKEIRRCVMCNSEFDVYKYDKTVCCSNRCNGDLKKKRYAEKKAAGYYPVVTKTCKGCNIEFEDASAHKLRIYCSRVCQVRHGRRIKKLRETV